MKLNKGLSKAIIDSIIIALIGLLFILIDPAKLMHIVLIVVGIFVIIVSANDILINLSVPVRGPITTTNLVMSIVSLVVGIAMIIWQNTLMSVILAIWFIAMPIVRIATSADKKAQFKHEIPLFCCWYYFTYLLDLGLFLDILFKIIGSIFNCCGSC
ncbi:MAG: hypothetical protein L6U99_08325 [Clostridium sp.]|nr:MAG: hypothetical protein L6U99_08325 [Clostridium sp.]